MHNDNHNWRETLNLVQRYAAQWARKRDRSRQQQLRRYALARAGEALGSVNSAVETREQQRLIELRMLKQRIAAAESERDGALRQVRALQTTLARATSRRARHLNWPTMAASVLLVVGAFASATSFQDKQNPWRSSPAVIAAVQDSADETAASAVSPLSKDKRKPASSGKRRFALRSGKPIAHRQWGPALLPASWRTAAAGANPVFDPLVKRQQTGLLALGFDLGQASADGLKGRRTAQALDEFQSLYMSSGAQVTQLDDAGLASLIGVYAQLAWQDAAEFGIDRGVLAAIRLGSVRTGVEFSYLMELAAAESNFNPEARAVGSSASGLYQFTQDTWLNTVKAHGEKYGLAAYASQIEYVVDRGGNRRPVMRDDAAYQHLLELRLNPRVAALMAAESVKDHISTLASVLDRKPARTELYLTHFFGPDDAVSFLQRLDQEPDTFAVDLFPEAAQNNRSIFHPQTCQPRTLTQVYEVFSRKFDTSRYEAWGAP